MTIYLITGPPAAGKTTWVQANANPGDITIDYDTLAQALGSQGHDHPNHVKAVVKAARQAAIDTALTVTGCDVYIIHGRPSATLLHRYQQHGAHIITIDPGRDIVLNRCKTQRPWRIRQAAKQWYDEATPNAPVMDSGQPDETRQW